MTHKPPSLSEVIRSLTASVVTLGRTRLELFGIELAEQKENALRMGIMAALGMLCLVMAAFVLTAFVAVLFWDTDHRLLAVGLLGLGWLLLGLLCLLSVMRSVRRAKHPFSLTLAELERDAEALRSPLADPRAVSPSSYHAGAGRAASGAYNPTDPGNPT